jgi:hypothetical protein
MATNHISYDRNKPHGYKLGHALEGLANFMTGGPAIRDAMIQMKVTGGSDDDPATYAPLVPLFGIAGEDPAAQNEDARSMFLELDALVTKMMNNGSQQFVFDAIKQALAKMSN